MGSIQYDDFEENASGFGSQRQVDIGSDFSALNVAGLVSYGVDAIPRIRYEVLLLSWLLVLSKTRSEDDASLHWALCLNRATSEQVETLNNLSANEILQDTQKNVASALHSISSQISCLNLESNGGHSSLTIESVNTPESSAVCADEDTLAIEIRFRSMRLEARLSRHDHRSISHSTQQHINAWIDMIEQCVFHPEYLIADLLKVSGRDLDTIWAWNHVVPLTYHQCMHDIITARAQETPEAEAICSWDGVFTYQQVDEYSTKLAIALKGTNVDLHSVVPVCLEKSKWTVVAILAVMKAGATFLLMDPSIPISRLREMAKQTNASLMITSETQHELSQSIIPEGQVLTMNAEFFGKSESPPNEIELPSVSPSTIMYIIFTSGSTGTPKGVMISHETYTSSAIPRAKAVGYVKTSRVLDFASYAFDVSIDSMLCTLSQGGCLCIPSDDDRMNDLNQVIRKMRITYAGLTPSVARILDKDVISSMDCLGLGGEAVTASNVNYWGQSTRIVIGYGPCECTIGCTINSNAACGKNYVSMGKGNGAVIWLVDPNDESQLSPIGAVGELWVEGPIVGQGYLNDPEKTAATFVNDPPWLLAGHRQHPGRKGRLYKTGDLVRYDPDGMGGFVFVGRKDTQVKLRGQRIELGEIEWQLKNVFPPGLSIIAEVAPPSSEGRQPMLVTFVAVCTSQSTGISGLEVVRPSAELSEALSSASANLLKVLPRYMVPTLYIPINFIPVLISGKTDRKTLRQFGMTVDSKSTEQHKFGNSDQYLNSRERSLRDIWSKILNCEADFINVDDNFFTLGGDSVAAMKLVSVSREMGFDLSVANIFLHPTLGKMAAMFSDNPVPTLLDVLPFSLISNDINTARLDAAQACQVDLEAVEDIYPCTPTQQSLFTFSLKSLTPYTAQRIFEIPGYITTGSWQNAWEIAIAATPILRVRIIRTHDLGLEQVELTGNISWTYATDLSQYLDLDQRNRMGTGQCLARYAIINESESTRRYMVWTVHHALYDGWSEPRLLRKVSLALRNKQIESVQRMQSFLHHLQQLDDTKVRQYWRNELQGAVGSQFPHLPSRHYVPRPDSHLEHHVSWKSRIKTEFTIATIIRGAWAMVASQHAGSNDVVFCETFTGRDIPLVGIESIEGPLIATTPVRVRIKRESTVSEYLQDVQRNMMLRAPWQHYGMHNIRKVSRDAEYACEARTGLVIQSESDYDGAELGLRVEDALLEALHFNPYPLMLAFGIQKNGFRICANFDSSLVDVSQAERLMSQIEEAFFQLSGDFSRTIGTISCLPSSELDSIWQMNKVAPLSSESGSMRLRAGSSTIVGSLYPPAAVGWVVDIAEPSRLVPINCVGELWLETAFSCHDSEEPPAWLTAGSQHSPGRQAKVQPTGDLVKLQADGSLIFLGRKEQNVAVQGHALDVAYLESQLRQYSPSSMRIAVTVYTPEKPGTMAGLDQKVVVLVEQNSIKEQHIQLLSRDEIITFTAPTSSTLQMTLRAKMDSSLVKSLKALSKFAEDTLQPHLIPFAYVGVDRLPEINEELNARFIDGLISEVPLSTLMQIKNTLCAAWLAQPRSMELTKAEETLIHAWATVLQMGPERIEIDDNFFRLGGDSVLSMKLVSNLRAQGHVLSVADLFQYTRLSDVAKVLRLSSVLDTSTRYEPFSLLTTHDRNILISDIIRPRLEDNTWVIKDVLPVTDSQILDIKATFQAPRTSLQYTMLYFDAGIDQQRLLAACQILIKAHDILRTVFVEHESTIFQVVVDGAITPKMAQLVDSDLAEYVQSYCNQDINSEKKAGSTMTQIHYVNGCKGKSCLIIALSHAQYDGISLPRIVRDLEHLYTGKDIDISAPFSSYIARTLDKDIQERAIQYWTKLLQGSMLTILNIPPKINARSIFLSKQVETSRRTCEHTTATLLTSAWALVLARHTGKSDITFGGITSGRQLDMPGAENVVGPCYQFTPIRISFESGWTGTQLLTYAQQQSAQSAAHDHLGFSKIAKCVGWKESFFNSLVHHQDWEDFDTMSFAGGRCRVDISSPHGDAAHPLKVVSFMKGGKLHAGIVGSQEEHKLIDEMLEKLLRVLRELSESSDKVLSL